MRAVDCQRWSRTRRTRISKCLLSLGDGDSFDIPVASDAVAQLSGKWLRGVVVSSAWGVEHPLELAVAVAVGDSEALGPFAAAESSWDLSEEPQAGRADCQTEWARAAEAGILLAYPSVGRAIQACSLRRRG